MKAWKLRSKRKELTIENDIVLAFYSFILFIIILIISGVLIEWIKDV